MACKCEELLRLHNEMLDLHIFTKTNDIVFHKASEGFYESLFDAYHQSREAFQDSKQEPAMNAGEARKKSYEILEKAKSILTDMVNENKDVGTDNVLRGLVDKISFDCGTARGFSDGKGDEGMEMKKSEDEVESKSEEKPEESDDVSDYGMAVKVKIKEEGEDEEESMENKEKTEEKNKELR